MKLPVYRRLNASQRRRRGAALYITVLSTALITSLLGMAALMVVRIERQRATASSDLLDARMNARAAAEWALTRINNDPDWRTSFTSGDESAPQSLGAAGNGAVSWILEDTDGDLSDNDTALWIKGIGRIGDTVQVSSVRVQALSQNPDFLRTVAHAGGDFYAVQELTAGGGPFSCNLDFNNQASDCTGDVEATSYSGGGALNGSFIASPAKELPPSTVLDDVYLPLATEIPWSSLTSQGATSVLSGMLDTVSNPTGGSTNPNAIYHIDVPASSTLALENLTLNGTLLVTLGPGASLSDDGAGNWAPFQSSYALLIVDGDSSGSHNVSLKSSAGVSRQGLIHVTGANVDLTLDDGFALTGTVVCEGPITVGGSPDAVSLTHDANLYDNPPLGYANSETAGVEIIAGTWLHDAAP